MSTSYNASLAGITASGYNISSKQEGSQKSTIVAETKTTDSLTDSPTTIHVDLTPVTSAVTKVSVRFGTFGDEKASLALMSKIKANL